MADADRRGFSNTETDAGDTDIVTPEGTEKQLETQNSDTKTVASVDDTDTPNTEVIQSPEPPPQNNKTNETTSDRPDNGGASTSSEQTEETLKKLLKAKEELSKARDELAQAKTEIEKAKLELTEAESGADTAALDANRENEKSDTSVVKSPNEEKPEENLSSESQVTSESDSPEKTNQLLESEASIQDEVPLTQSQSNEAHDPVNAQHEEASFTVPTTEIATSDCADESKMEIQSVEDHNTHIEGSNENNEETNDEPHDQTNDESAPKEPKEELDSFSEGDAEEHDLENDEGHSSEDDDDIAVEGEREEGDGEESENAPQKPVDDDEDRRNPQYIPKRGGFYEHDDRTREEEEENKPEEPAGKEKPKKGMRSEATERWGHDMFDESQQGPKSDQELVALYGYDIRKEEGAPRARRRRRYGRGPNKYSRTWEDEGAYTKTPNTRGGATKGVTGTPKPTESGNSATRTEGETRDNDLQRSASDGRGGYSRGGQRGGGSRGGRGRARIAESGGRPRLEEFPALSTFKADQEHMAEQNTNSRPSPNWRENSGREQNSNRGGSGGAISFRRGGGGRTFEERNAKAAKGKGDSIDGSFQSADNQQTVEAPMVSPTRDGKRNQRGALSNRGGMGGNRGSSRGGRGPGADKNWNDRDHKVGEPRGAAVSLPANSGERVGGNSSIGSGAQQSGATPSFNEAHTKPSNSHSGEHRGRGGGRPSGRIPESSMDMTVANMHRMRIEDNPNVGGPLTNRQQEAANVARSKRYSSQRQRMTSPPPPPASSIVMQPPYVPNVSSAYYTPYNDSPPPTYPPTSTYPDAGAPPLMPMVGAQGGPPYIAPPMAFPAAAASAPFAAGYQAYPAAQGPPPVQVGVPIGSPTQDLYAGGIMYYDTERQSSRHASQPVRRAKAAIPIVAPDADVDSLLAAGNRYIHE